jgi:hypothetical protein
VPQITHGISCILRSQQSDFAHARVTIARVRAAFESTRLEMSSATRFRAFAASAQADGNARVGSIRHRFGRGLHRSRGPRPGARVLPGPTPARLALAGAR